MLPARPFISRRIPKNDQNIAASFY